MAYSDTEGKKIRVERKGLKAIQRRVPKHDYLKYYRVVRYWAKKKYDLNDSEIEIIQYINSERLFTRNEFNTYCSIFSWNNDRFKNLLRDGWIRSWRNAGGGRSALYEASEKSRRMMVSFYKKLNGEENFPTTVVDNPVFKKDTYTNKVMANQMVRINKEMQARRKRGEI